MNIKQNVYFKEGYCYDIQEYDCVNKRNTSSKLRFIIQVMCVSFPLTTTADTEIHKKRKMILTSNNISCNGFPRYSAEFRLHHSW